ncbi:MAG: methyltransferase domain-containing protein [Bacteroidia bacterium]
MNFDRIYEYRFRGIDLKKKQIIWKEISDFLYHKLNKPEKVLDPAGGMCEFINSFPAKEKWAIDLNEPFLQKHADKSVKKIIGNSLEVDIPENYFELIFVSNFLEHLNSQQEVAFFLKRMRQKLCKGGKIVVMGPNFKYTAKNYFDFADHTVMLTELGLAEHLYGAGFNVSEIIPRFLPLSFRGKLPANKFLARTYLSIPLLWSVFGKQFLVIAEK